MEETLSPILSVFLVRSHGEVYKKAMGHFVTLIESGMHINNSSAYYALRCQKSVTCIHLYSRYRMIILKSPERVLISVSGEIGVQYRNNEITLNY